MKSTDEFQVGKHDIGWLDSDFKKFIPETSFESRTLGSFHKLERTMSDSEIESEFKPGTCELGDVIAFLDSAPQECKDGYSNIFYLTQCVVYVHWLGSSWYVGTWLRGDRSWSAGYRVFSPASDRASGTVALGSSDSFELVFKVRKFSNGIPVFTLKKEIENCTAENIEKRIEKLLNSIVHTLKEQGEIS